MVGANNVGKSTILEALDLVLGPERLRRTPPVEEFDFYNARYLGEGTPAPAPIPIRVEVVLIDLTEEIRRSHEAYLEFWHTTDQRVLGRGEAEGTENAVPCLRVLAEAKYDAEDDSFEANTYYCNGPNADEALQPVERRLKERVGFIYLRALRTGSRALSLERGSLLDTIMRIQGIRTGLWEGAINRLHDLDPAIGADSTDLTDVLHRIESRIRQYIPIEATDEVTKLFVSQLTREHLRKTLAFFIAISSDQEPVPFQTVGTGTLNTLVLALLSLIADLKTNNVIFAMEEPEIALPPHTQRRIAQYLVGQTTQCFVTTHSPYVIEQFELNQIRILRKDIGNAVATMPSSAALKEKMYRRQLRRTLAEAILGSAVIVAEGPTEGSALSAVAGQLERNSGVYPLDLSGISIVVGDGDGSLDQFGHFFRSIGLTTYTFCDQQKTDSARTKIAGAFDIFCESPYRGTETLLVEELPVDRLWQFLEVLRDAGEFEYVPAVRPPEDAKTKDICVQALRSGKGAGYAGRLLALCTTEELPATIVDLLKKVYADFPDPSSINARDEVHDSEEMAAQES